MGTIPGRRPARLGASATLSTGRSGADAHTALGELRATDARPAFLEAFRRLRTNIYHAAAGRDQRTILITSPAPGDGKTLCTITLAAVLVADRKRVLLINGDLHRQGPDERDAGPGLSDVLAHQTDWKEVTQTVETPHGTFDWIPSGPKPATPAELLSGSGFGALLAQCQTHYDYVLVDSPPFPLVSDALIMSTQADLVLSVLRLRNTPERAAEEHLRSISAASRQYGVIINDAEGMTFMPGYEEAYQAPRARRTLWSRFT
jgi:capsular exopolysaccharide synthesis family protein